MARGLIRVTAPVAFARQQLVPRMAGFLHAHPDVRVQLEASDRLSSIATEGFDLAIRHSAQVPETHVAWKLCDTYSVIVATRAYLKRRGTPATPERSRHARLPRLSAPAGVEHLVVSSERAGARVRPGLIRSR